MRKAYDGPPEVANPGLCTEILDDVDQVLADLPQMTLEEVVDRIYANGLDRKRVHGAFRFAELNPGAGGRSALGVTVRLTVLFDAEGDFEDAHVAVADPVAWRLNEGAGEDAEYFADVLEEVESGSSTDLVTRVMAERDRAFAQALVAKSEVEAPGTGFGENDGASAYFDGVHEMTGAAAILAARAQPAIGAVSPQLAEAARKKMGVGMMAGEEEPYREVLL